MPGLDGFDLALQARRKCPELRVLLISGYSDEIAARHAGSEIALPLRQKPFSAEQLAQRVHEILDPVTEA
jgi:two-component system cell cycle sensor histidine kinase/response regulator CckA